ncbi:hypothetical protein C8R44DRAFT_751378 [Mycena epipterygia]|nr:hypothetical protein C8R44DRAFT_751378 [Mycena epipterygia]
MVGFGVRTRFEHVQQNSSSFERRTELLVQVQQIVEPEPELRVQFGSSLELNVSELWCMQTEKRKRNVPASVECVDVDEGKMQARRKDLRMIAEGPGFKAGDPSVTSLNYFQITSIRPDFSARTTIQTPLSNPSDYSAVLNRRWHGVHTKNCTLPSLHLDERNHGPNQYAIHEASQYETSISLVMGSHNIEDITTPIVSAPMPFADMPELAVAVTAAGGLGCIGAGFDSTVLLKEKIRKIRTSLVLAKFGSEIGSNLNRTELNARFRFKVQQIAEPEPKSSLQGTIFFVLVWKYEYILPFTSFSDSNRFAVQQTPKPQVQFSLDVAEGEPVPLAVGFLGWLLVSVAPTPAQALQIFLLARLPAESLLEFCYSKGGHGAEAADS